MSLPVIAITMGDPAGIGPEVCLKLLSQESLLSRCTPVVFGDLSVLHRVADHLRINIPEQTITADQWPGACLSLDKPAVYDLATIDANDVRPGLVDRRTGAASCQYIEAAIEAALTGQVEAVVTGPVHKEALHRAGVPFPGHTELFATRTGAERFCMMLTCRELTCSFATTHVGYRDVPGLLTQQRILDVIELSYDAVSRLHDRPAKLTVCGLNPHAGEHGLFGGGEEERIIIPAIDEAREAGIEIEGPLPPDTAFLPQRRRDTDCFICMYHDQGHIPLKALAFDVAVNVTLGLPIVRTSVDHGTACDIAWQGKAEITSLAEAVELATRLVNSEPVVRGVHE